MVEKDFSLLSVEELKELLSDKAGTEEELDAAEGELIKRVKTGECDVSVLDSVELPSVNEQEAAEKSLSGNKLILPGAYAFPSLVGLITMLLGVVEGILTIYVMASNGSYFTDFMSTFYYIFSGALVEFGKFFVAGLLIRLLADIAYNTFSNKKD